MNLLERLQVRTKLIALLAIPTLVAGWMTLGQLIDRWSDAKAMSALQELVATATRAADLAHELQKERGFTAAFQSSNGVLFGPEMLSQRKQVDTMRQNLEQRLPLAAAPDSVYGHLRQSLREAERLGRSREMTDNKTSNSAPTTRYYSGLISELIDAVALVPSEVGKDEVTTRLGSLVQLMRLKEAAGMERAVVAGMLTRGVANVADYRRLLDLASRQETHWVEFRRSATPRHFENLEDKMRAGFARATAAIRSQIISSRDADVPPETVGQIQGNPKLWIAAQTEKIDALRAVEVEMTREFLSKAATWESTGTTGVYAAAGSLLGLIGLVVGIAYGLLGRLLRTLRAATEVAEAIANGNLSAEVATSGTDELGRLSAALAKMQLNLSRVVREVRLGSQEVTNTAAEISQGSTELNQRSVAQAASIEESAATLEQMSATSEQAAETAEQARTLGEKTHTLANDGREIAGHAMEAMTEVRDQSIRIQAITEVIDDIAFQTNLLALNASVEAARAGDQGRGFAVVATEIRSLAQRTGKSSREIRELVTAGTKAVEKGSDWVQRSQDSLEQIATGVSSSTQLLSEIASTSREHSLGISNLNEAISQLDAAAQMNASLVDQSTNSSQLLRQKAAHTLHLVGYFRVATSESVSDGLTKAVEPLPPVEAEPKNPAAVEEERDEDNWEDEESSQSRVKVGDAA